MKDINSPHLVLGGKILLLGASALIAGESWAVTDLTSLVFLLLAQQAVAVAILATVVFDKNRYTVANLILVVGALIAVFATLHSPLAPLSVNRTQANAGTER